MKPKLRRGIFFRLASPFAAAALAVIIEIPQPAAAYPPSQVVTYVSGSPSAVTVNNVTNASLPAGSFSFSIFFSTTAAGSGTVSVVPPASLTGTAGNTLNTRDFKVHCVLTSGSGLVSSGIVPLNGSTQCATLSGNNHNVTANFTVTLTLDDTGLALFPFTADTYASGLFTVTATAT